MAQLLESLWISNWETVTPQWLGIRVYHLLILYRHSQSCHAEACITRSHPPVVRPVNRGKGAYQDSNKLTQIQFINISVAKVVADANTTSLGPKRMDQMIEARKGNVTITNDDATFWSKYHYYTQKLVSMLEMLSITVIILTALLLLQPHPHW